MGEGTLEESISRIRQLIDTPVARLPKELKQEYLELVPSKAALAPDATLRPLWNLCFQKKKAGTARHKRAKRVLAKAYDWAMGANIHGGAQPRQHKEGAVIGDKRAPEKVFGTQIQDVKGNKLTICSVERDCLRRAISVEPTIEVLIRQNSARLAAKLVRLAEGKSEEATIESLLARRKELEKETGENLEYLLERFYGMHREYERVVQGRLLEIKKPWTYAFSPAMKSAREALVISWKAFFEGGKGAFFESMRTAGFEERATLEPREGPEGEGADYERMADEHLMIGIGECLKKGARVEEFLGSQRDMLVEDLLSGSIEMDEYETPRGIPFRNIILELNGLPFLFTSNCCAGHPETEEHRLFTNVVFVLDLQNEEGRRFLTKILAAGKRIPRFSASRSMEDEKLKVTVPLGAQWWDELPLKFLPAVSVKLTARAADKRRPEGTPEGHAIISIAVKFDKKTEKQRGDFWTMIKTIADEFFYTKDAQGNLLCHNEECRRKVTSEQQYCKCGCFLHAKLEGGKLLFRSDLEPSNG